MACARVPTGWKAPTSRSKLLRPLQANDRAEILRLQDEAYPDVGHDSWDVFWEKFQLFPEGCLVCDDGPRLDGYIFSHPWRLYTPVHLGRPLGAIPSDADCYYIHDLASLRPGVGSLLVRAALQVGQNWPRAALVAVHQTQGFWARFDFRELPDPPPALAAKLLLYSADAAYMIRP